MILIKMSLVICVFAHFTGANAKVSPEVQYELDQGKTKSVIVACSRSQSREFSIEFDNLLKEIKETSKSPALTRTDRVTDLVHRLQETAPISLE